MMGDKLPMTTTNSLGRWGIVLLLLLLVPGFFWWYWPRPRAAVYSLYRERGRNQALNAVVGYKSRSSSHITVHYTEQDENVVDWVLTTAEAVYEPVVNEVGYRPPNRIQMIIYPNRDDLRQAFGWGNGESAMGVYWSGTIRLLSPNVWIHEKNPKDRRKVFERLNPLAHEMTHYVLDYLTNGNYPRWFTEGLAQRVEYKITGYLWLESESTLRQHLYTLDDLESNFDDLRNQPLAYRQSYLLVDFIAKRYGEQALSDLVSRLGTGTSFKRAVEEVTGRSLGGVYDQWHTWVLENLDALDEAS